MFGLFRKAPLLDEPSRQWLLDIYAWALRNFGSDIFYRQTILVTPTDRHSPGRAGSVQEMAELVLEQVKRHAGMGHWPTRLVPPEAFDPSAPQRLELAGPVRLAADAVPETANDALRLTLTFSPNMVGNPQALIATFAHTLAHYMASLAEEEPPGGRENWPQLTEVLAVFMGFGLMVVNTAFKAPKGGCGSCQVPGSDRTGYLSQYDLAYALALFCTLKGISNRDVLPHLKGALRGFYKDAVRELNRNGMEDLNRLRAIDVPAAIAG